MTSIHIDALIWWTRDSERLVRFYRALGLPFVMEDHGDGHDHPACDIEGVHVAILQAEKGSETPRRGEHGATQSSFRVDDLDVVKAALMKMGELRLMIDSQDGPWGTRIVIEDPDGRPVQVTQPTQR